MEKNGGSIYVNSWYLTKVYSPIQQQTINFTYTDYATGVEGNPSRPGAHMTAFASTIHKLMFLNLQSNASSGAGPIPPDPGCNLYTSYSTGPGLVASHMYRNNLILKDITWDDTKISFMGSLGRSDLYQYKLDSVLVTCGNELRHKVLLTYGYFNSANADPVHRKLKLNEININDQRYVFKYYESLYGKPVPGIMAKGQDIWGYYNGEDDETVLPAYKVIGNVQIGNPNVGYYIQDVSSTPKNPDENFSRLGSLSEIEYPTGGKAVFEYEGNDYSWVGFENGQLASTVQNYYTNLELQDTRRKNIRVDSDPPTTPESMNSEREFIIHDQQQLTINLSAGFNFIRYQTMDYQTYMTAIHDQNSWAKIVLQKYNESNGLFEDLLSKVVTPGERIGVVNSQSEFQSKRTAGLVNSSQTITMTAGRYKVMVAVQGWYLTAAISGLDIYFPYRKSVNIYKGAGIRIKSVKFYSGIGEGPELVKNYTYRTNDGYSSGVLEAPFGNLSTAGYLSDFHIRVDYYTQSACYFANMTSETFVPLGNSPGGIIGYASVSESREDDSKTVYHYTTSLDNIKYQDSYISEAENMVQSRIRIKEDNSWKRGLLKQTDYFNSNNGLVQQRFNKYAFYHNDSKTAISLVLTDVRFYIAPNPPQFKSFTSNQHYYSRYGRHALKELDSVIHYSASGSLKEVTHYEYRPGALPHGFPVATRQLTSKGDIIISNTNYPQDYVVGENPVHNTAIGIKNLVDLNIVSQPIETWVQKQVQGNSEYLTTSGTFNQFKPLLALVDTVFAIRTSSGLLNYQPVQITSVGLTMSSAYKPVLHFLNYDGLGNILEQSKVNDAKTVFLWGYHGRYPVARIFGTNYASVANLVNQQILNEPATEEQLLQELNKIRTAFSNTSVQVYTYSYIPLKGISVEIDPVGRKTSYEYDREGRLILIRDQHGNIIKKICYNYQGQLENCNN